MKKVYAILSHVTFCSKARFVVRNTTIRFEFVEQVQVVERPVEEQMGLQGAWSLVQIELQSVAQQR
jgi:hypothetical protein